MELIDDEKYEFTCRWSGKYILSLEDIEVHQLNVINCSDCSIRLKVLYDVEE